jgi:hypothetical protein
MTLAEAVRRRRGGVNAATKEAAETFIRRQTTFRDPDLDRLDDGEQRELVEVIGKATDGIPNGSNFSRLSAKEKARYEQLVEKAAGAPGAFAAERDAAALRGRVAALARRAAKAARPKAGGEAALFEVIGDHLAGNILHAEHVACLAVILAQLQTGKTFAPEARLEGGGDDAILVVHDRFGLVGADRDEYGLIAGRWRDAVQHLHRNGYLALSKQGPEWRIGIGSRTRRALWGRS